MNKITKEQAEMLMEHGFKWYKDSCTDRVEAERIEGIYPTAEGFIVRYGPKSALSLSVAKVDSIEWRENPDEEWIYVHWIEVKDCRKEECAEWSAEPLPK